MGQSPEINSRSISLIVSGFQQVLLLEFAIREYIDAVQAILFRLLAREKIDRKKYPFFNHQWYIKISIEILQSIEQTLMHQFPPVQRKKTNLIIVIEHCPETLVLFRFVLRLESFTKNLVLVVTKRQWTLLVITQNNYQLKTSLGNE